MSWLYAELLIPIQDLYCLLLVTLFLNIVRYDSWFDYLRFGVENRASLVPDGGH